MQGAVSPMTCTTEDATVEIFLILKPAKHCASTMWDAKALLWLRMLLQDFVSWLQLRSVPKIAGDLLTLEIFNL